MNRILELYEAGIFDAQAVALAKMAQRYDDGLQDLPFVIAWISQWTQSGHVCLSTQTSFDELIKEEGGPDVEVPLLNEWVNTIPLDHPFVGDGSHATPMVVDKERGLLYLHHWFMAENRVVEAIQERLKEPIILSGDDHARLDKLFPDSESVAQKNAVKTALSSSFSIITGGPGTGKTTTILKLIDLFVSHHGDGVRIALCAPTGKAMSRMEESIQEQVAESSDEEWKNIFSFKLGTPVDPPKTLHRLLGVNPVRGSCRYNQSNKLPHDLIVIDESSMMDLLLMNQLIHAVRPDAHLILVGDKDQLPAVGSGTIFSDLCGSSGLKSVIGLLTKNWRAKEAPGIVELASLINEGQVKQVIAFLRRGHENVQWHQENESLKGLLKERALPVWEKLVKCSSPKDAFGLMAEFQILCAVRRGSDGVQMINDLARRMLRKSADYYHGLPIMISANDPKLKLYNGNLGVVLKDDNGNLTAWFPDGLNFRYVALPRLPAHEPVYAMTIHKSQGSEAENVFIVLPDAGSPILTRELLYTAITRAKKKVDLWASETVVCDSIGRTVSRVSGLPFKFMADGKE